MQLLQLIYKTLYNERQSITELRVWIQMNIHISHSNSHQLLYLNYQILDIEQ